MHVFVIASTSIDMLMLPAVRINKVYLYIQDIQVNKVYLYIQDIYVEHILFLINTTCKEHIFMKCKALNNLFLLKSTCYSIYVYYKRFLK